MAIVFLVSHPMFNTVVFFGAFCIVPAVDCADQIAGDAADAFEFLRLKDVIDVDIVIASS